MSFLDNLENNLKSLENREEGRETSGRDAGRRARERELALASAPWADALKTGPFTADLLRQAARAGHTLRLKVHIAWLGSTLRLEARERRLELRPSPEGVMAVYLEGGRETRSEPLNLAGNAAEFVTRWLEEN